MSPEEMQEYQNAIAQSLARANSAVGALSQRPLNAVQKAELNRIRTFIQQALDANKDDLVTARSLAERAEVLAQNLMNSLH